MEGEVITLQDIFVFEKRGPHSGRGAWWGRFRRHRHPAPSSMKKLLAAGIRLRPDLFDEVVDI